jgi:heme/copper-type cytochrome/quinol oxidase subunit 3
MSSVDGGLPEGVTLPPEPIEFRTRPLWAAARLWCGATTFFFAAFVFAYVYLRSLDVNHGWIIGKNVSPSGGLGLGVVGCFLLSAALWRIGHIRRNDTISTGILAIVVAVIAVVLQFVEYTTLGFGPASGAYASVFIGWTVTYALAAICGIYWIETQVATLWRASKREVSDNEEAVMRAGVEASSFYWAYFAAIGLLTFVILYIV